MIFFFFFLALLFNFLLCIFSPAVFSVVTLYSFPLSDLFVFEKLLVFNIPIQLWKLLKFSGCLYLRPRKGINHSGLRGLLLKVLPCSSSSVEQQWQPAASHLKLAKLLVVDVLQTTSHTHPFFKGEGQS